MLSLPMCFLVDLDTNIQKASERGMLCHITYVKPV